MPEEIYDPRERLEIFLNAVRTGDVEGLPDPQTREEMYLAAIAAKSALPDPSEASAGDTLVLDSDKKPVWGTVPIPETKKYYNHSIRLGSGDIIFYMNIITDSPASFTRDTLQQYIIDHGRRPCTGIIKDPGNPTVYAIVLSVNEVSEVGELGYYRFGTAKFDFTNGAFAYEQLSRRSLPVSDTVTEI